ncbi:MAG: hypothetical protein ABIO44_11070 [Saprospiraceae bacterium]
MNLQEFFNYVHDHPSYGLYYYLGIPALIFIISWISEPESYKEPWIYLYSILVYAVCIPGIFAVTLNIYFFFWERRSIMDAELMIQFLPILSMIASLLIIRRYVSFDDIPGFDKLSGLIMIIASILTMMWVLDRTQIFAFAYMPISFVLAIIVGGIILVRFAFKKIIT